MELLVVCAIMAFAACLPCWYVSFNTNVIARELHTLQSWLLAVQQKALLSGKDITISLDNKNLISDEDFFTFNEDVHFGVNAHTYGPPSSPTKRITDPISFNNHEMIFYHTGAMQVGTCYIVDKKGRIGALTCGLSLHGTIRCYELQGKEWHLLA